MDDLDNEKKDVIDVFGFVKDMRIRRVNMVQTAVSVLCLFLIQILSITPSSEVQQTAFFLQAILKCRPSFQDQYVFIHDTILDHIKCGTNEVEATQLMIEIKKLSEINENGQTGFEEKFEVDISFRILPQLVPFMCG